MQLKKLSSSKQSNKHLFDIFVDGIKAQTKQRHLHPNQLEDLATVSFFCDGYCDIDEVEAVAES